jgi:hypothetical protein
VKHPEYDSFDAQDAFKRLQQDLDARHTKDPQTQKDLDTIKAVLDAVSYADRYNFYMNAMTLIRPREGLVEEIGKDIIERVGVPGIALVKIAIT